MLGIVWYDVLVVVVLVVVERVADRRYSDSQSMAIHSSQIANSEGYADRLVVRVESEEADQLPRANCLSSC